ncbi:cystatin-like 1 [Hippopotamus amphibius kiboko]|uniref:cystatin-like 1 n=1 Tax=Hippopotamus amphibius kiboko TaxID=575201 RepID=UPI002592A226|nr:cystatin-like 1 [Hippopotamus amphibius kiboko]
MGAGRCGNPLLLLAALALAARLGQFQQWNGFQESMSLKNVNSTLNFFMETYNNNSNDSYLFRMDKLLRSQVQLTTGVEYLVTVKISRTKCKRNNTNRLSCPVQSKKKLQKSFICDFLVYTIPWMNHYQLWNNSCLDA